ncbi:MAG: ABC transporter ATP-binding protein [Rhodocyclales bacterium GT-UBC]|nr:MAG: ABC transporter ATP-binding protein [Rhodocyclales bacterium GT-UBC]
MFSDNLAIQAEGLAKTFEVFERPSDRLKQWVFQGRRQYGRLFQAVSDISFSLPKGRVLGLVGNNGAGKSTLLQMICGTLTPSAGQIKVSGRVAALLELGAGFNPDFSGRENIFLNASILGLSRQEILARYDDIVAFSGIGDFIEQPVKTYSSGMYVRLAFAIATSIDPDILIIDEALSVGDGAFARKSFDRIMSLKERGTTILFCSHSMYHIEAICDTAIWLERGKMMMLDTPQKVVAAYTAHLAGADSPDPASFCETPPAAAPTSLARLLRISASADGTTGKHLKLTAGRSALQIEVEFQADTSLPPPTIAFGLETKSGTAVSTGSTYFDATPVVLDADGRGRQRLTFPGLPLMRGEYRLSIFLACEQTIHVYDQAPYCVEFEVEHHGIEQGVVFLPHAWNDGPVFVAPEAPHDAHQPS